MTTVTAQPMANPRGPGRPPAPEGEETRMVRLPSDLADMIGWIVKIRKKKDSSYTAAKLCGPLLRPGITSRYKQIEKDVESIKRLEDSASEKGAEE